MVGAEIRARLVGHGSPTWEPDDDHTWREWIEFQGDAFARRFVKDLDEVVHRMTPGLVECGEWTRPGWVLAPCPPGIRFAGSRGEAEEPTPSPK